MHEQISPAGLEKVGSAQTMPSLFDNIAHYQKEIDQLPKNSTIDHLAGLYALQEEIDTAVAKVIAELHRIGYAVTDTPAIDDFLRLIKRRDIKKLDWAINQLSQLEIPASKELLQAYIRNIYRAEDGMEDVFKATSKAKAVQNTSGTKQK